MRMSGGFRAIAARSRWGVSPVRIPTRTSSAPMPRRGTRRFRSMSYASAFNGLTYTTRVVGVPAEGDSGAPGADGESRLRRSSAHRNAASVLPEPVGAETSTCSPPAITGHAIAWAGVGAAKACSNHFLTLGLKLDSGTRLRLARPRGSPARPHTLSAHGKGVLPSQRLRDAI